ncbi:DUF305 domain-containing protein [Streptomyces avermitilis]|uniref:hypothetical protein n=1 Tax=Streptomyces avermitilis TaxID=33903 RepID=UPI0036CA54D7
MAGLKVARDKDFDKKSARLVISHHRGAVSASVASLERSWSRAAVGSLSIWAVKG